MEITPAGADSVNIVLGNEQGDHVTMTYCPASDTFSVDRRESGIVDFSQDFPSVTMAPAHSGDKPLKLRIFIDRSSIEVFGRDGRFAMTNLVFPNSPYTTLSLDTKGGKAKVSDLRIYNIDTEK